MKDWVAERSDFIKEWMRAPLVTASIVPSSYNLARAMARSVDVSMAPVLELGPGTGVITRQLLNYGIPEQDLILVEVNHFFANQLRRKFPLARVIHACAEDLVDVEFDELPGAAVSGIPFMSMPNNKVSSILQSVFSRLRPQGRFVQFTYAPRCPVNRDVRGRLGLEAKLSELVWRNVPPASVYHISKMSK